jgi:hypothetical protein
MREVIVDLPPHPLHLLPHRLRQLRVAERRGPLRFLCEHRERRLQAVRQVARLRDRAADGAFLVLEQRVQIVDERLHFARVVVAQLPGGARAHVRQALPHLVEGPKRTPHQPQPGDHARDGDRRRNPAVRVDDGDRAHRGRADRQQDRDHREQPERPEDRPQHHAGAQRTQPDHPSTSTR